MTGERLEFTPGAKAEFLKLFPPEQKPAAEGWLNQKIASGDYAWNPQGASACKV